jgi:hypothetical protein
MGRWRVVLAGAGIGLGLYGVGRLLTNVPWSSLVLVGLWLVLALVIHDGLLSPAVVAASVLLGRIPSRGRRYLQFGLIMAALLTVIALPMISQQQQQPPAKTLLQQDYQVNLMILLVLVAAGTLAAYAVRVARDRRPSSSRTGGTSPSDPPRSA